MRFDILTLFPEAVQAYADTSLLGKAQEAGLLEIRVVDLRDFTDDKHRTVDDRPYGGGPGMVLMVEPIYKAVRTLSHETKDPTHVVLFSTRGSVFTQDTARRLKADHKHIICICGRYEGVDERVATHIADEEISIGNFVLSGGELPALIMVEAVSRHIPGVLGKEESLEEAKGSYPVYTRPEVFHPDTGESWEVPEVLRSGDHSAIESWRRRSLT